MRTLSAAPTTAASPRIGADAGVGDGLRVAQLGRHLAEAADVDGDAADLERDVGGDDEAGLDGRLARRLLLVRVLGHPVGVDDAVVGRGVVLQQLLEPLLRPASAWPTSATISVSTSANFSRPWVRLQTMATSAAPSAPTQAETLPPPGAGFLLAASSR